MSNPAAETVLPSGRFAKMRPLTGKDYLCAIESTRVGLDITFCFIAIGVQIDDEPVRYDELIEMDIRDVFALIRLITPFVAGPVPSPFLPPIVPPKDS